MSTTNERVAIEGQKVEGVHLTLQLGLLGKRNFCPPPFLFGILSFFFLLLPDVPYLYL